VARRVAGDDVEIGSEVKLSPGGPCELINVSETGALVETRARVTTGTAVALCIGGPKPQRIQSRVVRSQVCAIHRDSTMTYQIGLTFDEAVRIEGLPPDIPVVASAPTAAAPPVVAEAVATAPPALVNEW
jgi:hypothetical protein